MSDGKINDGGPAFPQPVESLPYWDPIDQCVKVVDIANHAGRVERGASLRDYFASKAMQATLSTVEALDTESLASKDVKINIANSAYEMADAMLAARNK